MRRTTTDRRRTTFVVRLLLWMVVLLCGCAAKPPDALARIQSEGVLRVALDPAFPPFEFVDGEGQLMGLDVDLARSIAARLGVDAHFVTTGYDALYDALTVGRADVIISALYPDPSRTQAFAFSPAYFNAGEVLIVPDDSPVSAVDDLAGLRVALVFGTEAHVEALRWEKTLQPPPILLTFDGPDAVIETLDKMEADAVVIDNVAAHRALAHIAGLRRVPSPITDEPYTVAARKEDARLIDAIGDIILTMQAEGELDALIRYWMENPF